MGGRVARMGEREMCTRFWSWTWRKGTTLKTWA